MPLQYHERGRYRKLPVVRALFATNLLFAVSILVAWQAAVIFVIDPMTWAADSSLPSGRDVWHMFQYPMYIFWAGPSMAMAGGWVLMQSRNYKAALGLLLLPLLMAIVTVVLYWIVPFIKP